MKEFHFFRLYTIPYCILTWYKFKKTSSEFQIPLLNTYCHVVVVECWIKSVLRLFLAVTTRAGKFELIFIITIGNFVSNDSSFDWKLSNSERFVKRSEFVDRIESKCI